MNSSSRSGFNFVSLPPVPHHRHPEEIREEVMATNATTPDPFESPCHWTSCASVEKVALRDLILRACGCGHSVHISCLKELLKSFNAPPGFDAAACSKSCYHAIQGRTAGSVEATAPTADQNRPLRWNNDGPTPDVCSLSVLLEWITAADNYKRFASCVTQLERSLVVQEVIEAMAARALTSKRSPAEIVMAITLFEKSYTTARDWIKANEDEVMDPHGRRAAILKRCIHYDRLYPVMRTHDSLSRPMHPPRSVSVDSAEDNGRTNGAAASSQPAPKPRQSKKQRTTAAPSAKSSQKPPAPNQKPPLAVREAEARIQVALAHASKLRQEEHLMSLQAAVMLLRERVKLRQEGVPQDDIDNFLPLYPSI